MSAAIGEETWNRRNESCDLLFISLCGEFYFTFSCLPSSFASTKRKIHSKEKKIIAHFVHTCLAADGRWRKRKTERKKTATKNPLPTTNRRLLPYFST